MRKLSSWLQFSGLALVAAGVAAFSIPFAAVVVGVVLIVAGEVHG